MGKAWKRVVSLLLALALAVEMGPVQALAAEPETVPAADEVLEQPADAAEEPSLEPMDDETVAAAYAAAYAAGELFVPEHPEIAREVYELRTATEKHFELADGTYRVHGKNGEFLCLSRAESGTLTSIKNFFGA